MNPSLLSDAAQAGLFHITPAQLQDLPAQAIKSHRLLLTVDLSVLRNIEDVLRKLGTAFDFPIWYGANFDALHDCLADTDWQPNKGLVLLISGLETLRKNDLDAFATLIDVLRAAAETRSATGHPLWILLTSPARGVASVPPR